MALVAALLRGTHVTVATRDGDLDCVCHGVWDSGRLEAEHLLLVGDLL